VCFAVALLVDEPAPPEAAVVSPTGHVESVAQVDDETQTENAVQKNKDPLATMHCTADKLFINQTVEVAPDEMDCRGTKVPTSCSCRCREDLPVLTFAEAADLLAVSRDLSYMNILRWITDRTEPPPETWEARCRAFLGRKDLLKWLPNLAMDLGGRVAGKVFTSPQFLRVLIHWLKEHALVTGHMLHDFLECVDDQRSESLSVRIWRPISCHALRDDAVHFLWKAHRKHHLKEVISHFQQGLDAFQHHKSPIMGAVHFIAMLKMLGDPGPFQKAVMKRFVRLITGGLKVADTLVPGMNPKVRVAQFLLKTAQELEIHHRLRSARNRESAVLQCVAEVGCSPRGDCPECEELGKGLYTSECGVTLSDEARCELYGTEAAHAGVFVAGVDFRAFRHGLRACDVIQSVQYLEGGSLCILPQRVSEYLGLGERKHNQRFENARELREFFDRETELARETQDVCARTHGLSDDIGWRVETRGCASSAEACRRSSGSRSQSRTSLSPRWIVTRTRDTRCMATASKAKTSLSMMETTKRIPST
jgi:hypothetical protein